MSKMLEATCSALGVVSAEGVPVPVAEVLSEGAQESSGVLLLEGEKAKYLTSNASDIKTTLSALVDLIEDISSNFTTIASTLTAIGAGMTGPTTAPPGTLATSVLAINNKVLELNAVMADLDDLKDALK